MCHRSRCVSRGHFFSAGTKHPTEKHTHALTHRYGNQSCGDRHPPSRTQKQMGSVPHALNPPMKEDPRKLPLCWSPEQPVTSCLLPLHWFTHVQPSQIPPQPRKHISYPLRARSPLYLLNIYTIPHPLHAFYHAHQPESGRSCWESTSCVISVQIREVRQRFKPNNSINTAEQSVCSCLCWPVVAEIKNGGWMAFGQQSDKHTHSAWRQRTGLWNIKNQTINKP